MPDETPLRVVVVINQKGGCGKTTSALSVTAGLALEGYKTTLVDLDAQCNATSNVGSSRVDLQACKLEYSIVSPK